VRPAQQLVVLHLPSVQPAQQIVVQNREEVRPWVFD
jgi:hypothetical protein